MKNLILPAVIGLLCMTGGFYYGMRLMPVPSKKAASVATAPKAATPTDVIPPEAISMESLKKTSEGMMSLNEALRAREQAVAFREQKLKQREEELDAERATLDASHEKFKQLFHEFQDRLQLVSQNQADQLQKQADLYATMGLDSSIDLIRVMDDAAISRLFSVMETKSLGKMVTAWKAKYPADAPRLIHDLDAMALIMPKEKMALSESPDTVGTPAGNSPAPANTPSPAATPDAPAPDAPASDGVMTPPANDPNAPAAPPAPDATPSTPDSQPQPLNPPPDAVPAKKTAPTSTASN